MKASGIRLVFYSFTSSMRYLIPLPEHSFAMDVLRPGKSGWVDIADVVEAHWQATIVVIDEGLELASGIDRADTPASLLSQKGGVALITPKPVSAWGHLESVIEGEGFTLVSADNRGMDTLANWLLERGNPDAHPVAIEAVKRSERKRQRAVSEASFVYPAIIRSAAARFTGARKPEDKHIDLLITQLKDYLGAQAFDWLCAVAVYPIIRPDLTRELARSLTHPATGETLYHDQDYLRLSALPWFDRGRMPNWLRDRLISSLDPAFARSVHETLWSLLVVARNSSATAHVLERAGSAFRNVVDSLFSGRNAGSIQEDEIFSTFMNSRNKRIPAGMPWRQRLRVMLRRAIGLWPWLAAALLSGAVWIYSSKNITALNASFDGAMLNSLVIPLSFALSVPLAFGSLTRHIPTSLLAFLIALCGLLFGFGFDRVIWDELGALSMAIAFASVGALLCRRLLSGFAGESAANYLRLQEELSGARPSWRRAILNMLLASVMWSGTFWIYSLFIIDLSNGPLMWPVLIGGIVAISAGSATYLFRILSLPSTKRAAYASLLLARPILAAVQAAILLSWLVGPRTSDPLGDLGESWEFPLFGFLAASLTASSALRWQRWSKLAAIVIAGLAGAALTAPYLPLANLALNNSGDSGFVGTFVMWVGAFAPTILWVSGVSLSRLNMTDNFSQVRYRILPIFASISPGLVALSGALLLAGSTYLAFDFFKGSSSDLLGLTILAMVTPAIPAALLERVSRIGATRQEARGTSFLSAPTAVTKSYSTFESSQDATTAHSTVATS
jgi:hypothetical protein